MQRSPNYAHLRTANYNKDFERGYVKWDVDKVLLQR